MTLDQAEWRIAELEVRVAALESAGKRPTQDEAEVARKIWQEEGDTDRGQKMRQVVLWHFGSIFDRRLAEAGLSELR